MFALALFIMARTKKKKKHKKQKNVIARTWKQPRCPDAHQQMNG